MEKLWTSFHALVGGSPGSSGVPGPGASPNKDSSLGPTSTTLKTPTLSEASVINETNCGTAESDEAKRTKGPDLAAAPKQPSPRPARPDPDGARDEATPSRRHPEAANGWDFRGQLIGAGSKVLSPISSSSRFVKSFFWGSHQSEGEVTPASPVTDVNHVTDTSMVDDDFAPCFGVNIPPESRTEEAQPGVYYSRTDILKMIKKCQGARFKAFTSVKEAESFSQMNEADLLNSSLVLKTPSKPRNPVFINSPPPPPKLQQQEQNHIQLQQQQQPAAVNNLSGQGERLAFKAPKTQELMGLRRYIVAGNLEHIRSVIWSNPRYLISSGDTPTIVQEGFHYTAMHVAARHGKHEIIESLIEILTDPNLMTTLYGEEPEEVVTSRQRFLLDLYLNLPDKGANDTPLHIACKYGHLDVIKLLLSHPLTARAERNKFQETPAEVVCSRCPRGEDEADALRLEILRHFERTFVVPILRPHNGLGYPRVGHPTHFTSVSSAKLDPSTPKDANGNNNNNNYFISAYAGPMQEKEAFSFQKKLSRPSRSSTRRRSFSSHNTPIKSISSQTSGSAVHRSTANCSGDPANASLDNEVFGFATPTKVTPPLSLHASLMGSGDPLASTPSSASLPRLTDSEKGLEHEGRLLAAEMGVGWKERWEFLSSDLLDVSDKKGMRMLEDFFRRKYEEIESIDADVEEMPLEDSFEEDSLGDLNYAFRSKLVIMSPTKEDHGLMDDDGCDDCASATALVNEIDQFLNMNETGIKSPATLRELCRQANPFDHLGVTNDKRESAERELAQKECAFEATRTSKPAFEPSPVPFEAQFYIKGSFPSRTDTELLHALRNCAVDDVSFPYLHKWMSFVKTRHTEDEIQRWPSTPGNKTRPATPSRTPAHDFGLKSTPVAPKTIPKLTDLEAMGDYSSTPKIMGLRPTTLSFDFSPSDVRRTNKIVDRAEKMAVRSKLYNDENDDGSKGLHVTEVVETVEST